MANITMEERRISGSAGLAQKRSYYAKTTVSAPGNGSWILIPNGVDIISAILDASSGAGYVEATNDYEAVIAETTPDGVVVWDNATITSTIESSMIAPVVAVRAVSTTSAVTLCLMASE